MTKNPQKYFFELPNAGRPDPHPLKEFWYPGVRETWEKSTSSRIFDPILGVRGVAIHATAGSSSSGAMSVMKGGKASWHWLVADENEKAHGKFAWACAPESRAAWHIRNSASHPDVNGGNNKINHWSLGIELVNSQKDSDTFSDWQIQMTAEIVRYAWAKYPNLQYVFSHAMMDPARRTDPGINFDWDDFRDRVLSPPPAPESAMMGMSAGFEDVKPISALTPDRRASVCGDD